MREGFHPDFVMTVHDGAEVIVMSLDAWLERMGLDGEPNPEPVEGRVPHVDVTGGTAIAKVEIHEGGEHVYTDYFGLYETDAGWKIVNKIFHAHPDGT